MDWVDHLAADAARVITVRQLFEVALPRLQRVIGASAGGVVFECTDASDPNVLYAGLRSVHVDEYMTHWRVRDPTLHAARQRRLAVRNRDASHITESAPICVDFARRVGVRAYLVVPVYAPNGSIAATFHLCRRLHDAAFDDEHVQQAIVFSGFLSAMLARLRSHDHKALAGFAPREYQVALLAARGRSNPDIARQLGLARETVKQTLRRVYRKASVASRTELAAQLARDGWL